MLIQRIAAQKELYVNFNTPCTSLLRTIVRGIARKCILWSFLAKEDVLGLPERKKKGESSKPYTETSLKEPNPFSAAQNNKGPLRDEHKRRDN